LQDKAFRQSLPRAAASVAPETADAKLAADRLPPVLPGNVQQFYLPSIRPRPKDAQLEYHPLVLGFANVVFILDKHKGTEHSESVRMLAKAAASGHPTAWDAAEVYGGSVPEAAAAEPNARWAGVPESLDTGRKVKALEKAFVEHLYTTHKLSLWENRTLGLLSAPGESEAAFRGRCRAAADMEKKQALEMEKVKFRPKFEALDLTLPDEAHAKTAETAEADDARQEEKRNKVRTDYISKTGEIAEKWKRIGEEAAAIQVKPRKTDVHVTHFGLGWAPYWRTTGGTAPAYQ
jgi:hypothetical protein